MLEALDIESPKLVINLLPSPGLGSSLNICTKSYYDHEEYAALLYNRPPFLNDEDEQILVCGFILRLFPSPVQLG